MMQAALLKLAAACLVFAASMAAAEDFDVLIHGGTVYDGSGTPGRRIDVGLQGDRIAVLGDLRGKTAKRTVNATGLAVAPGFINMLSWATDSLLVDGDSQSDIRQGVTLELLGEGMTMGPLNEAMKQQFGPRMRKLGVEVSWTTLAQYLELLEKRGVSPNVASFIGATTVRLHVIGAANRHATPAELQAMQQLVRQAMQEGAFGVSSALAYAPAAFANTEELIALAKVAAEFGGIYISHLRDEGDRLVESVDEVIEIARAAHVPAEIYHLKALGAPNWNKLDVVIDKVEAARKDGVRITADMYPYTASATGLDVTMPPWVQEGGIDAWIARLKDPAVRARLVTEMQGPSTPAWSNRLRNAGSPENILILGAQSPRLQTIVGKTLGAIAGERGTSIEDTVIDLVIEDGSRLQVAYFLMSESNVRRAIALPWMSFGSDADSPTVASASSRGPEHPRAYGTFARVLGKYVRDDKVVPLEAAVRRLSSLPAETLGIADRGRLAAGRYADVVIFDPATIADHATFEDPHRYAVGMRHVFVNGVQVLADGEHTGAKPGRVVRHRGHAAAR